MNRRGFLGGILAAACAPAIVRADSLMRIVPRDDPLFTFQSGPQWVVVGTPPQSYYDAFIAECLRTMHANESFIHAMSGNGISRWVA